MASPGTFCLAINSGTTRACRPRSTSVTRPSPWTSRRPVPPLRGHRHRVAVAGQRISARRRRRAGDRPQGHDVTTASTLSNVTASFGTGDHPDRHPHRRHRRPRPRPTPGDPARSAARWPDPAGRRGSAATFALAPRHGRRGRSASPGPTSTSPSRPGPRVAAVSFTQTTDTTGAKTMKVSLTTRSSRWPASARSTWAATWCPARAASPAGSLTLDELTLGTASLAGDFRMAVNSGAQAVEVGGDRLPGRPLLAHRGRRAEPDGRGRADRPWPAASSVEQATSSTGCRPHVIGASGVSVIIGGPDAAPRRARRLCHGPRQRCSPGGLAAQLSGTVDLTGLLPASVQVSGDFELA